MYVIYLNCELYGVTTSKEKAWETLTDYYMKKGYSEDFIENEKKFFENFNSCGDGDNWISFTGNIF